MIIMFIQNVLRHCAYMFFNKRGDQFIYKLELIALHLARMNGAPLFGTRVWSCRHDGLFVGLYDLVGYMYCRSGGVWTI